MKVAREQNPQVAEAWEQQFSNLKGSDLVPFAGLDLAPESTSSGLATAVTIFRQQTDKSLDSYVVAYIDAQSSLRETIKPVAHWRVYLTVGAAEEVQFRRNVTALNGQVGTTMVTQYLIIKGKDLYMLTFSTTVDQAEKYAPTFEKIAQSFQWVN